MKLTLPPTLSPRGSLVKLEIKKFRFKFIMISSISIAIILFLVFFWSNEAKKDLALVYNGSVVESLKVTDYRSVLEMDFPKKSVQI
jgi:hypothetical protein